jgi:hypothetical protein
MVQAIGTDGEIELEALLDALEADYLAADLTEGIEDHLVRRTSAEGMGRAASAEVQRQARLTQARMDLILEARLGGGGQLRRARHRDRLQPGRGAAARLPRRGSPRSPRQPADAWRVAGHPRRDTRSTRVFGLRTVDPPRPNEGARADGNAFDLEVAVSRLEADGVVTYTGFHRDVSAAKAEQAKLGGGARNRGSGQPRQDRVPGRHEP